MCRYEPTGPQHLTTFVSTSEEMVAHTSGYTPVHRFDRRAEPNEGSGIHGFVCREGKPRPEVRKDCKERQIGRMSERINGLMNG